MPLSTINSNSFSSTANTNIDNGALFIDAVNGRVGAGTTAPISQFHAKGAGSGTFAPYNDPLVVEGSDYTYLHLKSTNNQAAVLYNRGGSTGWFHGLDNSGNLKTVYMSAINGTALGNAKDGTAAMLIDSSNRITKPLQPLLVVGRTAGNVNAQTYPIPYNQVIYNVGSHWNASTYRFTAPVTGYYFCGIRALATGTNIEVAVYKNGGTVVNTRCNASSGTSAADSSIVFLTANDYIDAKVEGSGGMNGNDGYPYSGMTVYLVG